GDDTLLDPGPGTLVDPDDRAAGLHREVHDLRDLLAVHLAEAAAEHGEVLGEHADHPAVDRAVAGDDAVAVRPVLLQPEVGAAVPGQLVDLDERALVEEQVDPLASGLLAPGVLLLDGPGRSGVDRLVEPELEIGQLAGRGVDVRLLLGIRRGRGFTHGRQAYSGAGTGRPATSAPRSCGSARPRGRRPGSR